jgi:hypothetical protein
MQTQRWMRAMHIDAFFEYCLGHPHHYFTHLPAPNGPPSDSRDGVPFEEDLALRALVPEWKPKRGRKRAEDRENDESRVTKRPQLDTSVGLLQISGLPTTVNFPQSAIPFSAFPEDIDVTDPWGAASSFPPDASGDGQPDNSLPGPEFPWRSTSPVNYPQSAVIPRGHHPADLIITHEPHSAVGLSSRDRSRTRRRHGPAVSSAWPSSHSSTTGKVRGRPPIQGSAPSGPFSSFPANPRRSATPLGDNASIRSSPIITGEQDSSSRPFLPIQQTPTPSQKPTARPNKLQLQVPPHLGRPVRLATSPTVMVNGTDGGSSCSKPALPGGRSPVAPLNNVGKVDAIITRPVANQDGGQEAPPAPIEDIIHTISTHILRGKLIGRLAPLGSREATALAHAAVSRLRSVYGAVSLESLSLLCSTYPRNSQPSGLSNPTPTVVSVKLSSKSSENKSGSDLPNTIKNPSAVTYTITFESNPAHGVISTLVLSDLSLEFEGDSQQLDLVSKPYVCPIDGESSLPNPSDQELDDEFLNNAASEVTWKQRFLKLRKQMQKKDLALREYKRNIVQSVMADI